MLLIKSKQNLKRHFTKISERLKIQVYLLWRLKLHVAQMRVQTGRRLEAKSLHVGQRRDTEAYHTQALSLLF